METCDARAHHLGLTDTISEGGGPSEMVRGGGRRHDGGAEGEIRELGSPGGGGVKPGRWVSVEMVAREFQLRVGLKGEVVGFNLNNGFAMFRFQEAGERGMVLRRLWVVAG